MKKITNSLTAMLLSLVLLLTVLPAGVFAEPSRENNFTVGADSAEILNCGGRLLHSGGTAYYSENGGVFLYEDGEKTVLFYEDARNLNASENALYFTRDREAGFDLCRYDFISGTTEIVMSDEGTVGQMYLVNDSALYYASNQSVFCYDLSSGQSKRLMSIDGLWSFAPTPDGLVYATGALFDLTLYAADILVATGVSRYHTELSGEEPRLVYTTGAGQFEVSLADAFVGTVTPKAYTGFGTVDTAALLSQPYTEDEAELAAETQTAVNAATPKTRAFNGTQASETAIRGTLTQGQQNAQKRAYQMTDIEWTPKAAITGWGAGLTYAAGTTYKGLPYGQAVYASYVPWSTDLEGFIAAVNNVSGKMYTDYSSYNKRAPYYSTDCSAFVSWALDMSARQTTSGIASKGTLISTTSYADIQVGDYLNKAGSHVVLCTDITYDTSGAINGIEISEATVVAATNYCCQRTWYGTGFANSLSYFATKYFDGGYTLYRSNTISNVSYTHTCVSPVEGDVCTVCGYGVSSGEEYTVTYETPADYTAPSAEMVTKGENVTLPGLDATLCGYLFMGWTTAPVSGAAECPDFYYAGESFIPAEDTTLYALFCTYQSGDIYYAPCTASQTALAAALSSVGATDTSYAYRRDCVAAVNYIYNYTGSATQNTDLLERLKAGLLVNPEAVSALTPAYTTEGCTCLRVVETVTAEASCTTSGTKEHCCAYCGYSETENLPPLGHNYTATVTEPTCAAGGYTLYTCARCGDTYQAEEVSPLAHTLAYADLGDGTHKEYCTACGVVLATAAHSYVGGVCEACGSVGYTVAYETPADYEAPAAQTLTPGDSLTLPELSTAVSGYVFMGWTTADVPDTTERPAFYYAGQTFTPTENVTLYALFSYYCTGEILCSEIYYPVCTASQTALAAALSSVGATDTSYAYRRDYVAAVNYVYNYTGSASQNTDLLERLKAGLLVNPEAVSTCTAYYGTDPSAPTALPKITAAYLRLDADINLIYTVTVPEGYENPYMVFTLPGKTETVTAYTVGETGEYSFTLPALTPQRMGDNITATLYASYHGKTYNDAITEYSVRQYCVNLLETCAEDTKLVTLLSDLLTYGAAAQTYTGYRTDSLVTEGLSLTPRAFQTSSDKKVSFVGTPDETADWTAATLVLKNALAIRLTFAADSTENLTVTAAIGGRNRIFDADDFVPVGAGRYYVDVTGILATEFDENLTASFARNGTSIGRTVCYSVNTYICGTQNTANAPLQTLVRALYNYGVSAEAYGGD